MSRKFSLGESAKRTLDTSIHAARELAARVDSRTLAAYARLLAEVRRRTNLLSRRAVTESWRVNRGLLAMALHHDDWLAPIEGWSPGPAPPRRLFASLAEHLFARFPMPELMASVWTDGEPGEFTSEQGWYKVVGLGQNIRRANVPMRITRGMAHRLFAAPHHLGMVGGLRWAQVRELGGSDELAHAVVATRLGNVLENEDFWESAVHFFVNHPDLPLEQIGPIVDFLQHQKLEWREGVSAEGVFGRQPPPEPELTIKGRTCASLLRLVDDWHRELARSKLPEVSWPRAPFRAFRWLERRPETTQTDDRLWTITELCTSRALLLEGRAMRHCVSTYVGSCVSRRASIWSMQVESRRGHQRVLTIDVDLPLCRVVQARRKLNARPCPTERMIVRRWAEREGISVPSTLQDLA